MPNQRKLGPGGKFTPRSINGLSLWLDASATDSMFTSPDGKVDAAIYNADDLDLGGASPSLWLRADNVATIAGRVTQAYDVTGNYVFYPPAGATGPQYLASAQNGLPILRFDGNSGLTATLDASEAITGSTRTYFVVCRTNASGGTYSRVLSLTPATGNDYSGVIPCVAPGNSNTTLTPYNITAGDLSIVSGANAFCVYTCSTVANGSNVSVTSRINGLPSSTTTSAIASNEIKIGIGCNASGANRFTGDIAEVIIFTDPITSAFRASIEKYLANKWGIPGVHSPISQELTAITSPTEIGGLQLWADASDFTAAQNNTAISQWNDKSGYGKHFTQSDSTKRPVLQYTANNGKPALYFDAYDWMLSPASPKNDLVGASLGSPTLCISTVCWQDPLTAGGSIAFGQSVAGGAGVSPERLVYYALYGNTSTIADIGAVNGGRILFANSESLYLTPIVITLYRNGATMQVRRNGVVLGEITNAYATFASATTATQFTIGKAEANTYGGAYFSEMVAYSSGLSIGDVGRIEAYLAKKWNISGVTGPTPIVGYLADRSGRGRHATATTASSRPILNSVSQNGKPTLYFDGTDDKMSIAANVTQADPISMFAVVRRGPTTWGGGGGGGYGSFLNSGGTTAGPMLRVDSGNIEVFGGTNKSSIVGTNVGMTGCDILCGTVSSRNTSLYLNGVLVDADAAAGSSATGGTRTAIGEWNPGTGGGGPLNCYVAELIACTSVSESSRKKAEQYLAAKWGIQIAPSVANVEAQDWITRVYQNGGKVSASTALAVSNFADAINAVSGLRSKFIRLNLCCGDSIAAATVPLYRSTSYGGTVIGNSVDTPNNWASGDYSEANGFQATATGNETNSSKYLACGAIVSALPAFNNAHLAFDFKMLSGATGAVQQLGQVFADGVGAEVNLTQYRMSFTTSNTLESVAGGTALINRTISTGQRLFCVTSRQTSSLLSTYLNGGSKVTDSTFIANRTLNASASLGIFAAWNGGYSPAFRHIISAYSFGSGLSDDDVTAYSNAMATFKAAVGRT